jgi:hypothetical protein
VRAPEGHHQKGTDATWCFGPPSCYLVTEMAPVFQQDAVRASVDRVHESQSCNQPLLMV